MTTLADASSLLPPPLPADKGPLLGYAIVNGFLRFLSVSQIVHYDARQEGGCPRKWAFEKVFHKKKVIAPDDPRNQGKRYAREAEMYLKFNYDALSPVMRAGKHLLPKPGPDLEVEEPMAGDDARTVAALALRDRALAGEKVSDEEIERAAGLALLGIPLVGAADYGHQRGYYLTDGGILVKEPHPNTFEVGDHKAIARIRDHVAKSRKGGQPTLLPGYAKTPEQIGSHPQMLGYGVRTHNKHSHIEYVRLGHNYYQRKNGYSADKRSILLPVSQILDRWRGEVEPIVRQMIVSAKATKPEDVPYNLKSCRQFNRDCPHAAYCDRPAKSFQDFVADAFGGGDQTMEYTHDNLFPGSGTNGAVASPPAAPQAPSLPMTDDERARAILVEREKLAAQSLPRRHPLEGLSGYVVGQPCNGRGFYQEQTGDRSGHIGVEVGHSCAACVVAPALPSIGAVNPVDAPPVDHIASSDPLTPEAIAEITNPELRVLAEAHAKACAERAAAEVAARAAEKGKKPTGCGGVGQRVVMTDGHKLMRKARCPGCNKEVKIKDGDIDMSTEPLMFVVPKHRVVETALVPVVPAPVPAAPPVPPVAVSTVAPTLPPALPLAPVVHGSFGIESTAESIAREPPPNAPPPLSPNARVVGSTGSTELLAPEVADKRYWARSTLFLNTVFVRGEAPKNLDEYARDLVKTLQTAVKLDDFRYAPDGHDLSFGRWKGALTKMVKANPLPPGEYALYVGGSEVRDVIADAVADMLDARVVKGAP